MSCFPAAAQSFDAVRADFESGDIVLFDNDSCALGACCGGCCCCACCVLWCRGVDVNNACCARSWRRAAMVLVDGGNNVYAFQFNCPDALGTSNTPPALPSPRDVLSNTVRDVGFRLVPLAHLLAEAAQRGAYVHALRKLYINNQHVHGALGALLKRQMCQLQRDAASITVLQVEALRKQGGIRSVSGTPQEADRRLFAAVDSGYLTFYLLRKLGLAAARKMEKFYDVEDLLAGGDIEDALVDARLGREIAFYFSPMKPPESLAMV